MMQLQNGRRKKRLENKIIKQKNYLRNMLKKCKIRKMLYQQLLFDIIEQEKEVKTMMSFLIKLVLLLEEEHCFKILNLS